MCGSRVAEQCWARSRSQLSPSSRLSDWIYIKVRFWPAGAPALPYPEPTTRSEELWSEHGEEKLGAEARFFFICESTGRVNKSDLVFNLTRRVENLPVLYFISSSQSPITKHHIKIKQKRKNISSLFFRDIFWLRSEVWSCDGDNNAIMRGVRWVTRPVRGCLMWSSPSLMWIISASDPLEVATHDPRCRGSAPGSPSPATQI